MIAEGIETLEAPYRFANSRVGAVVDPSAVTDEPATRGQ